MGFSVSLTPSLTCALCITGQSISSYPYLILLVLDMGSIGLAMYFNVERATFTFLLNIPLYISKKLGLNSKYLSLTVAYGNKLHAIKELLLYCKKNSRDLIGLICREHISCSLAKSR